MGIYLLTTANLKNIDFGQAAIYELSDVIFWQKCSVIREVTSIADILRESESFNQF